MVLFAAGDGAGVTITNAIGRAAVASIDTCLEGGFGRPSFFHRLQSSRESTPMFTNRSNPPDATAPDDTRRGFIARLRARLNQGDSWLTYDLANLLPGRAIDAAGPG